MDNPPWEATAIINGIWEEVDITNIELFEALIEEKKKAIEFTCHLIQRMIHKQ